MVEARLGSCSSKHVYISCTWFQHGWLFQWWHLQVLIWNTLWKHQIPLCKVPSWVSYHSSCSCSHCISSTYSTNHLSYPLLSISPDHTTSPPSYPINLHTSLNLSFILSSSIPVFIPISLSTPRTHFSNTNETYFSHQYPFSAHFHPFSRAWSPMHGYPSHLAAPLLISHSCKGTMHAWQLPMDTFTHSSHTHSLLTSSYPYAWESCP